MAQNDEILKASMFSFQVIRRDLFYGPPDHRRFAFFTQLGPVIHLTCPGKIYFKTNDKAFY
jgi:hypothetical protein